MEPAPAVGVGSDRVGDPPRVSAEIRECRKRPGRSPAPAPGFEALIQTPPRWAPKPKRGSYSPLGRVDRHSAGKPRAYQRGDRPGNRELKAASYRAFRAVRRPRERVSTRPRFSERAPPREPGSTRRA